MAEAGKVGSKVLIDTSNELDFSKGMPPALLANQERCVAENIQKAFPQLESGQDPQHNHRESDGEPAGGQGR